LYWSCDAYKMHQTAGRHRSRSAPRRIDHPDRTQQLRPLQHDKHAEIAAERMPHAEHRYPQALDMLELFRDQMRPAFGHRTPRIVPDGVDIADLEIALEIREHLAVARGRKAVGVGEMEDHCRYSHRSTLRGARRCQE